MKVFVTGATGFIGRALVLALQQNDHSVIAWVRDEARARALLGEDVELLGIVEGEGALSEALNSCQGVINLAGEPIFGKRWSKNRREAIIESRVSLTSRLAAAIGKAESPPEVFLSGSAVGFYGDRGSEEINEGSLVGEDFLASVCREWEQAALDASSSSTRVVCLRTGIVLGQGGGALEAMLPLFRFGLGGPLGNGRQFVPWIHLEDCIALILSALHDPGLAGPLNVVGPSPITQKALASALGKALRRTSIFPAPRIALRAILGEAASALLSGQRCYPRKAEAAGFLFRFQSIESALEDLVVPHGVDLALAGPGAPPPQGNSDYLRQRPPRYFLRAKTIVDAPLAEVFDFFSKPTNLALLTPPKVEFTIHHMEGSMGTGATIEYRLRVAGFRLGWRSRIEQWEKEKLFVDSQDRGPYRSWWHEHHFVATGRQTMLEDRVYYSPPMGLLGRIANRVFIGGQLKETFHYRAAAVRLRFGDPLPDDTNETSP